MNCIFLLAHHRSLHLALEVCILQEWLHRAGKVSLGGWAAWEEVPYAAGRETKFRLVKKDYMKVLYMFITK